MRPIKKKYNCIAIVGPTASGKSELAVFLAKKLGGEIVSADSRQVYRYLTVGTNKVPGAWKGKAFLYKGIPHYCIDFIDPQRKFTVVEYRTCAHAAIKDIMSRGKIPILAGGTGFYIEAVIDNIAIPEVEPHWQLRRKLERKAPAELFRMLEKLDPRRAGTIDPKNPRRLIRAIEIITVTGKPVPPRSDHLKLHQITRPRNLVKNRVIMIGIRRSRLELKRRITKQVREMLKQGLVAEVKKLQKIRLPKKRIRELGFEYSYPLLYLENKISKKELRQTLIKENWRYAKRQITWWNKDKRITWISPRKSATAW